MRCSSARPSSARCSPASACPASPSSRSERGGGAAPSREAGLARPPLVVVLLVLALLGFAALRYVKAVVAGESFAGAVRGAVLANPMMPDEELLARIDRAAAEEGVTVEPGSVRIQRGQAMLAGGAVSSVRLRYHVPVAIGPLRFERTLDKEVQP